MTRGSGSPRTGATGAPSDVQVLRHEGGSSNEEVESLVDPCALAAPAVPGGVPDHAGQRSGSQSESATQRRWWSLSLSPLGRSGLAPRSSRAVGPRSYVRALLALALICDGCASEVPAERPPTVHRSAVRPPAPSDQGDGSIRLIGSDEPTWIRVFDEAGPLVFERDDCRLSIDIPLPPGRYVVVLESSRERDHVHVEVRKGEHTDVDVTPVTADVPEGGRVY